MPSEDRSWTLLFNDQCPLCRMLARRIHQTARSRVQLVPLGDERAVRLLKRFHDDEPPRTFFLIEETKSNAKLRSGPHAALHLTRVVGIRESLRLLALYLAARGRTARVTPSQSLVTTSEFDPDRRGFLSLAARGAIVVGMGGLASLAVGTVSAGCKQPEYSNCLDACNEEYDVCLAQCGTDMWCAENCRQRRGVCYTDCCTWCTGACPV